MKKASAIALIIALTMAISCSKKDDIAILSEEKTITDNTEINKKINELKKNSMSEKDDFKRSEIFGTISELQLEKGDIASSSKSANESIKYYPGSAIAHYVLGKSYLAAGRYTDAETELKKATELDPKHTLSWFELGNLMFIKHLYSEAVAMYNKAADLDKNDYQVWNNTGSAYYMQKKGKESEDSFKKVIAIKSDFAPVYKNLGLLYERLLKDKKKAKASYEEYLNRRPNAPERAAVKFWINEMGK
jgi:tetratricopeptide (TPR) repeat protein